MKTGSRTTYILLDRGSDDIELLKELHKITAATGISDVREFIKIYPRIHELKRGLQHEKEGMMDVSLIKSKGLIDNIAIVDYSGVSFTCFYEYNKGYLNVGNHPFVDIYRVEITKGCEADYLKVSLLKDFEEAILDKINEIL